VVDAPPVLAASEALFIAREADGTLLCTMRDVSRGGQVKLACERLRAAGVRPLGAVLSGVPLNRYTRTYGGYDTYLRQESSPVGWSAAPSAGARPANAPPITQPSAPSATTNEA
jgi:Mrp family chromosome partitioning ATPase